MTARKKKLPLVAVCGRPNVGKSTLFNRLIGKQRAIVHGEEGITRDRTYGVAVWENRTFGLVDTGGVVDDPVDPITRKIQDQVQAALEEADVILFVVDAQGEITRTDEEIRDYLLRLGKPVVLAANKLDNPNLEMHAVEFYSLGLGEPYPVSSTHGTGVGDLMDAVLTHLPEAPQTPPEETEEEDELPGRTRIAIVGKPNTGKSSFINAILNEERTIVTEVPGTTRDAIDVEFHWKGKDYLLIDTAGLRRKAGIREDVERFSVSRSLRAVRRADVCLLMMDATEGITEQDKRILGYIQEQGRAHILVWTKWDLVEDKETRFKELKEELDYKAPYLKDVPFLTVSNITRQRLFTAFEYVDRVAAAWQHRVSTGELNRLVQDLRRKAPGAAMQDGQEAKIRYATQASVKPPVFVLFVNQKRLFHFSYLRFIENQLRAHYDFAGVPIRIELREGEPKS